MQIGVVPANAREIDGGEFYAQMKAPTRVRDMSADETKYRWVETGAMDHYRHAHALDHLVAKQHWYTAASGMAAGERESYKLLADYRTYGDGYQSSRERF